MDGANRKVNRKVVSIIQKNSVLSPWIFKDGQRSRVIDTLLLNHLKQQIILLVKIFIIFIFNFNLRLIFIFYL